MHGNCTTVKYMHCHIALYSKTTSEIFKQQNKSYKYSLLFSTPTAIPWEFYQSAPSVHIFLTHWQIVVCWFWCLWLMFLLSLSQFHNKSQHTDPINYTAYSCSQMQDYSEFWSQLALYTVLFYW